MQQSREIYIVLSNTGSWLTRIIGWYTRAPHNHASIALDGELKEAYSFGRKQPRNPFMGGFVKEDFNGPLFKDADCEVYAFAASPEDFARIRGVIGKFERDRDRFRYNLLGLFGVALNVPVERRNAFFCSQFVAYVFEQTGIRLSPKDPPLTTPTDLVGSDTVRLVYQGKLQGIRKRPAGIGSGGRHMAI